MDRYKHLTAKNTSVHRLCVEREQHRPEPVCPGKRESRVRVTGRWYNGNEAHPRMLRGCSLCWAALLQVFEGRDEK